MAKHADVGVHGEQDTTGRGPVASVHDNGLCLKVLEVWVATPHQTMVAAASPVVAPERQLAPLSGASGRVIVTASWHSSVFVSGNADGGCCGVLVR